MKKLIDFFYYLREKYFVDELIVYDSSHRFEIDLKTKDIFCYREVIYNHSSNRIYNEFLLHRLKQILSRNKDIITVILEHIDILKGEIHDIYENITIPTFDTDVIIETRDFKLFSLIVYPISHIIRIEIDYRLSEYKNEIYEYLAKLMMS